MGFLFGGTQIHPSRTFYESHATGCGRAGMAIKAGVTFVRNGPFSDREKSLKNDEAQLIIRDFTNRFYNPASSNRLEADSCYWKRALRKQEWSIVEWREGFRVRPSAEPSTWSVLARGDTNVMPSRWKIYGNTSASPVTCLGVCHSRCWKRDTSWLYCHHCSFFKTKGVAVFCIIGNRMNETYMQSL